jgi:diaminopimelate decarboxylase
LNLGGGTGIAYTAADDPLEVAQMAEQIGQVVRSQCQSAGLPVPALSFEPGRAIVGPAGGLTVYEVGTVKRVLLDQGQVRTYVSVDGGMSDNIRTALYDAADTVTLASRASVAEPRCSPGWSASTAKSGDVVVRDAWLPADLVPGDLLAVAATGAYCRAMASNCNLLPRPAVIGVHQGRSTVLLRRETLDDLLALDPGLDPGSGADRA